MSTKQDSRMSWGQVCQLKLGELRRIAFHFDISAGLAVDYYGCVQALMNHSPEGLPLDVLQRITMLPDINLKPSGSTWLWQGNVEETTSSIDSLEPTEKVIIPAQSATSEECGSVGRGVSTASTEAQTLSAAPSYGHDMVEQDPAVFVEDGFNMPFLPTQDGYGHRYGVSINFGSIPGASAFGPSTCDSYAPGPSQHPLKAGSGKALPPPRSFPSLSIVCNGPVSLIPREFWG